MKKALALLAVLMLSTVAFAGPYFEVTQDPTAPDASLTVGWNFSAPFIDMSALSVTGDFYAVNDNLWIYPTPWIAGFDLGLDWRTFALDFGMDVTTDPLPWPAYVSLTNWTTSLKATGYPSNAVTIWGQVDLVYAAITGPLGTWNITPTIGIRCEW